MFKPIKITEYDLNGKLPDPFVFDNGKRVKSAADWSRAARKYTRAR